MSKEGRQGCVRKADEGGQAEEIGRSVEGRQGRAWKGGSEREGGEEGCRWNGNNVAETKGERVAGEGKLNTN